MTTARFGVALLAVFSVVAFAAANGAKPVAWNPANFDVEFVSATYRHLSHTTVFTYRVTTGASPLAHWLLNPFCGNDLELANPDDQDWLPYGLDSTTGKFGFEALGQDPNTVQDLDIIFVGDVNVASDATQAEVTVKSGSSTYSTKPIVGPVCSAGIQIKNANCSQWEAQTIPCTEVTPAPAGVFETVKAGRCPNEKQLHWLRNFTVSASPAVYEQCEQVITVQDKDGPTFSGIDEKDLYITLSCNEKAPDVPTTVEASDTCQDSKPSVEFCEKRTNGSCPNNYFLLRTWTTTDECGNSKCLTQTIAYLDDKAPTISGVPADKTDECDLSQGAPVFNEVVTVDDHGCDCFSNSQPGKLFDLTTQQFPGECANTYELKRTWKSVDCCLNKAEKTQVYKVKDTIAPTLTLEPANQKPNDTVQCDAIPAPVNVEATDKCMVAKPFVNMTEKNHTGSCTGYFTIERIFTACDDCGNSASYPSFINVIDTGKPTWDAESLPSNKTIECGADETIKPPTASDTCSSALVTKIFEQTYPGNCPNEKTVIRTWLASDDCSNNITYTHELKVVDTTKIEIDESSLPEPRNYQCANAVPTKEQDKAMIQPASCGALPHCSCNQDYDVYVDESVDPGSCLDIKVITRTFTLSDKCGNNDTIVRHIYVNDTTVPNLYGDAPNGRHKCNAVPGVPTITTCDNCDGCDCSDSKCRSVVNPTFSNSTTDCPFEYTETRSWNVTDDCGNNNGKVQVIEVYNSNDIVFDNPPGNIERQCDDVPEKLPLTATADCGTITVNNNIPDEISDRDLNKCSGNYTITRVWTATDLCGRSKNHTQIIKVIDTVAPRMQGIPPNTEASCSDIPPPPQVCAADNCVGVKIDYEQTRQNYSECTPGTKYIYQLNRTWVATDRCGNKEVKTQIINVFDRDVPNVASQGNTDTDCENPVIPNDPSPTDACTGVHVTPYHERVNSSLCDQSYVLYRNFYIVDDCGNFRWLNYTVTVTDKTGPTFDVPADRTDRCTPVKAPATNLDDNCDESPQFLMNQPSEFKIIDTCVNDYVLQRTWTAKDECQNPTTKAQNITVYNDVIPSFPTPPPATVDFQCADDVTPYGPVSAIDGCGNALSDDRVTMTPIPSELDGCPNRFTINRTWVATDLCGLVNTTTQIVRVNDSTKPTLSGVPANTTVNCGPALPPKVCASDNCKKLDVYFSQTKIPVEGGCKNNYILKRTWRAVDACGNEVEESQYITVVDTEAPQFPAPPGPQTAVCAHVKPNRPDATDNCLSVNYTDYSFDTPSGICAQKYVHNVAWQAMDPCGNVAWWNYTITVDDSAAPGITSWIGDSDDQNVTCGNNGTRPTPIVNDNCNTGQVIDLPDEDLSSGVCSDIYSFNRRWNITDACGNHYVEKQLINGQHNQNPTIAPHPTPNPEQVESCTGTPSSWDPQGTDMCGRPLGSATLYVSNVTNNGLCVDSYDTLRLWNISDACLLTAEVSQLLQYRDTKDPTVAEPSDYDESNKCAIVAPVTPGASDDCDNDVTVTLTGNVTLNKVCDYIFDQHYTWTGVDNCLNDDTAELTVHYKWTSAPTLSAYPSNLYDVPCDNVPDQVNLTATDGCGKDVAVNQYQERIPSTKCNSTYTLVRTWNATDNCSLPVQHVQYVYVVDHSAPKIWGVPGHVTAECGFVPKPPTWVFANDTCPGVVRLTQNDTIITGDHCCNYTIKRTWFAQDECGNDAEEHQYITVVDTIKPRLHGVPADRTEPCPWTPDSPDVFGEEAPLALGYCVNEQLAADADCASSTDTPSTVTINGNTLNILGHSVVEYANGQAAVDLEAASGSTVYTFGLTLGTLKYLNELPLYTPEKLLDNSCYGTQPDQVSADEWNYYTAAIGWAYDGTTNYTLVEDSTKYSQVGTGANGFNRKYGATLFLKNGAEDIKIHLDFTNHMEGNCALNTTEWPELECGGRLVANETNRTVAGDCPQEYQFIRTWCVADKSDNSICKDQTVTVTDLVSPVISGLPNETIRINCSANIPPPVQETVSDCDPNPTVVKNETRVYHGCLSRFTLTYHYYATDACGNPTSYASYDIEVVDEEAPTLVGIPSTTVHRQCNESSAPATVTASDNCGINTTLWPTLRDPPEYNDGPQNCPQSFRVTYTYDAEDDCGQPVVGSYDIVVRDDNKPTINNVPGTENLECNAPVPSHSATASDPCDTNVPVTTGLQWFNTSCKGFYSAQRTFNAKDDCDNMADPKTQMIYWTDSQKPYFTSSLPANVTVQCNNVPPKANVTAFDDCEGVIVPGYSSWETGDCKSPDGKKIYRQWIATDCSSNSVLHLQVITVIDTINPTITPAGPNVNNAPCNDIPLPPVVCAADNCDGVSLDYTQTKVDLDPEHPSASGCARYTLVRTWVATDACGNTNTTSYNVTVNDQTKPSCTWTAPPATVPCTSANQLVVNAPSCSDECSGPAEVMPFHSFSDNCLPDGNRKYAFRVRDKCGNTEWYNATVTIVDTNLPTINGDFSDVTLECPQAPGPFNPSASDLCDPNVPLTNSDPTPFFSRSVKCPEKIYNVSKTYNAVDDCGNNAEPKTKTWIVLDTVPPFWSQAMPANTSAPCDNVPGFPPGLMASDTCTGPITPTTDSWIVNGSCPKQYTIYRKWNATDCADLTIEWVQRIDVFDNSNPSITFEPPLSDSLVSCKGPFPVPKACASDNCGGINITYIPTKNQANESCDQYTITRTWQAHDDCGNPSPTYTQVLTVNDQTGPTCDARQDAWALCSNPHANDPTQPACTDDCSTVAYSQFNSSRPGNCLDRYYNDFAFLAVDGCLNPTWRNVTVEIRDNDAPTFDNAPGPVEIECQQADNYPVPNVTATDNCDPTAHPEYVPVSNGYVAGQCANYTIVRSWTLKDRCENIQTTHFQTITVRDKSKPIFNLPLPVDTNVSCDQPLPKFTVTARDDCGSANVTLADPVEIEGSRLCNNTYKLRYTWTATDLCGLTETHSIVVSVYDDTKPTISSVEPVLTATCGEKPAVPKVCCSDTCDGVRMVYTTSESQGPCDAIRNVTRTWTCYDACGNNASVSQLVVYGDTKPPVFLEPIPEANIGAYCEEDPAPDVFANDTCSGVTKAAFSNYTIPGGCDHNYTIVRTWTATDDCGVNSTVHQNVSVYDNVPPTTCTGQFECYEANSYGDQLPIKDITKPNNYFCANDECSSVNITLVSCVSNQDGVLNAQPQPGMPGFTDQCFYDSATDTLLLSGLIDTTDVYGRMFVITAVIMDQCGLSVTTSREVFVPLNITSFEVRNITEKNKDCTSFPVECPSNCPCQTVDHYCADPSSADQGHLTGPVIETIGDQTTYSYTLVLGAFRPTRIAIGVDLTKVQFLSATPDNGVSIGELPGSLLTGVFWSNADLDVGQLEYNITVRGVPSSGLIVPYQLGGQQTTQDGTPTACESIHEIVGIADAAVDGDASTEYSGSVNVIGALSAGADIRNASFPLKDVVVQLINKNTKAVIASVLTAADGSYKFVGFGPNTDGNHHVVLSSTDGFLRGGRSSSQLLSPTTLDVLNPQFKWGPSQSAVQTNGDFGLLINGLAKPTYNRPATATGFQGNSHLESYWRHQYASYNSKKEFSSSQLAEWSDKADALADCAADGFTHAPNTFLSQLRAAALNLASARGPFEPYDVAGQFMLSVANHICKFNLPAGDADQIAAASYAFLINTADDIDN